MKRISTIIIAIALVFGLAQCKKQETPTTPTDDGKWVHITLNVGEGDRHFVYPNSGAVAYVNGDEIYVGNNHKYVGTLTRTNGAFEGDIYNPSSEDYLHFYFIGGTYNGTLTAGQTESFDWGISDQSSNLPVLSYGHSSKKYTDGNATYSCMLKNQCALVKFGLDAGTNNAVTVSNMLTEATVNFATPGITPKETTDAITLYSESATEKWAILLPQESAIEGFTVNIGSNVYNVAGSYTITNNGYINSGIVIANATNLSTLTGDYVAQDGEVLTGTLSEPYQISIAPDATVTLKNATISGGNSGNHAGITCQGDANIVLEGSNYVKGYATGSNGYSGILIAEGHTLTISGSGSLTAQGNGGAGIGACDNASCGNIVIQGGTITADGTGAGSSGIGAGYKKNCGDIRIEGGTIIANGSTSAAGIGGGSIGDSSSACGNVGNIIISGGNVTATGGPNSKGAGIGQGFGSTCGDITIGFGIDKVVAKWLDPYGFADPPYPQCIGSYNGENTVNVYVADGLTDSGDVNKTRTIQH